MTYGSPAVAVLFVGIVVAVAIAFLAAAFSASKARKGAETGHPVRTTLLVAIGLVAWLAPVLVMAQSGALLVQRPGPPVLARMVLIASIVTFAIALSPIGKRLVETIPLAAIVGFQAFRIPVEIVLDALYRQGALPVQMTFEGLNFDVVSGLSAIVVGVLAARGALPRWGLAAWNVGSLLLLIAIVVIANTSMPGPIRLFHDEPSAIAILAAPFIWLPTFLVPCALFGHLLVFRSVSEDRARPA